MAIDAASQYLYLNRGNRWLDFEWRGLELAADGTLRLASLPSLAAPLPAGLAGLPVPTAPAGVAVLADGTLVWTDPADQALLRTDCLGGQGPFPCVGGLGSQPTQLHEPRGVLYHRIRRALFVADTANDRIQIFDPETSQLIGVWKGLKRPWALADDANGNVYVVSDAPESVQKFDVQGTLDASFGAAVKPTLPASAHPVGIAVADTAQGPLVYLLDAGAGTLTEYSSNGASHREIDGSVGKEPLGIAVTPDAIYIGDNTSLRIRTYRRADGSIVGDSVFGAPIAALAVDPSGNLVVATGGAAEPVAVAATGAYVRKGFLWSRGKPFPNPSFRLWQWHWLRATLAPLQAGAHVRLAFATLSATGKPPRTDPIGTGPPWSTGALCLADVLGPSSAKGATNGTNPASCMDRWVVVPWDSADCIFPGSPGVPVWIGVEFSGEGQSSPALSQLRIDFDHQTYLQYLPAFYTEDPVSGPFLARFLTLFESLFAEVETDIGSLPALFSPWAAPAPALDWVGGLLDVETPEDWSASRKRRAIAAAFAADARRGTVTGLEETIRDTLGVVVRIEEPILQAGWWALPDGTSASPTPDDGALLGFTTMLASYEPQGAVVGTSAVIDQSQLVEDDDYAAGLFRDLAHRFSVWVYRGSGDDPTTLAAIRALLESEKPAHTVYDLCVVEPRMTVGFQSRIGIDTIVGESASAGATSGLMLGGPEPGRIGVRSEVGRTTRLGSDTVDSASMRL